MQKIEKEKENTKTEKIKSKKTGKVENGLFIFRRDLRIVDNQGLEQLKTLCNRIYTIFIFTPEQVSKSNSFKSKNAVQFMIESLVDLSEQIDRQGGKLYCFYGKNERIVDLCIEKWNIGVVGFNKDYTPYALARDEKITKLCDENNVSTVITPDYYLYEPGTIYSVSNQPYQKFTPFYETCLKQNIELPKRAHSFSFQRSSVPIEHSIHFEEAFRKFVGKPNARILVSGGRENAIKKMRESMTTQQHYEPTHNDLDYQTSELSAYIKFGCISIREIYKAFQRNKAFVRQLIWRDFYMNILYFFPHVLNGPMKPSYKKIHWRTSEHRLNAWKNGETGFPVVDAGMRQMNETGYMHNRARLIVSSFLVKTLLIDWQEGEKYFAQMLVDYDPASNNGNWQWTSGTGADSQPYFRIFNPWEQAKHYDSECNYIKQWIPELQDVPTGDILRWDETCIEYKKKGVRYPCPMVDYSTQKEEALEMYRSVFH